MDDLDKNYSEPTSLDDIQQTLETELQALGINIESSLSSIRTTLILILALLAVAIYHFW